MCEVFLTISFAPFHSFRHCNNRASMALAHTESPDSREHHWNWRAQKRCRSLLRCQQCWKHHCHTLVDSSLIHLASFFVGQFPPDLAHRWNKKEKKILNIQRPISIKLYNKHTGKVDLMYECITVYPYRRKNKLVVHLCILSLLGHLYKISGLEKKDLLQFKVSVGLALINAVSIQTNTRWRPSAT